jgi:DNA-binding FrmR family transcriptional regulator
MALQLPVLPEVSAQDAESQSPSPALTIASIIAHQVSLDGLGAYNGVLTTGSKITMAITGETKRVLTLRLAKAIGHLMAVQRMVEDEKYCIDVLNQLKAVQAALDRTAQLMLKQHLDTCVVEAVKADDSARVMEELWQLLRKSNDVSEDASDEPTEETASSKSCCQ